MHSAKKYRNEPYLTAELAGKYRRAIRIQTVIVIGAIALGMVVCYLSGDETIQGLGTLSVFVAGLLVHVQLAKRRISKYQD